MWFMLQVGVFLNQAKTRNGSKKQRTLPNNATTLFSRIISQNSTTMFTFRYYLSIFVHGHILTAATPWNKASGLSRTQIRRTALMVPRLYNPGLVCMRTLTVSKGCPTNCPKAPLIDPAIKSTGSIRPMILPRASRHVTKQSIICQKISVAGTDGKTNSSKFAQGA